MKKYRLARGILFQGWLGVNLSHENRPAWNEGLMSSRYKYLGIDAYLAATLVKGESIPFEQKPALLLESRGRYNNWAASSPTVRWLHEIIKHNFIRLIQVNDSLRLLPLSQRLLRAVLLTLASRSIFSAMRISWSVTGSSGTDEVDL